MGNSWASALVHHRLLGGISCKTSFMKSEKPSPPATRGSVVGQHALFLGENDEQEVDRKKVPIATKQRQLYPGLFES